VVFRVGDGSMRERVKLCESSDWTWDQVSVFEELAMNVMSKALPECDVCA
jgi:hypothetical protein